MAEWLKAHDSKSCGLARVSEVRILSLPPRSDERAQKAGLVCRFTPIESSLFRHSSGILPFFRACSSMRCAAHEENSNLLARNRRNSNRILCLENGKDPVRGLY